MAVTKISGSFDRATNPHTNPTDFAHEICIQQMRILADSSSHPYTKPSSSFLTFMTIFFTYEELSQGGLSQSL